ncbi:MAG: class I SAM-dependent methyltransferase [Anaerolineae bacterium]|nr:class I SAM-dependent methyltransferase [Anaerolineae bacterium]
MQNNVQSEKLYTKRATFYERFFVDSLGWGKELERFFRGSDYLKPRLKVLDAGCGTGVVTRTLYRLTEEQGYAGIEFHAFDASPQMLDIFQQWIDKHGAINITVRQADVLARHDLPPEWGKYDLIVCSTMLEYLPKADVKDALIHLRQLLCEQGILLVFITKQNPITRWLGRAWWKANLYEEKEIAGLLHRSGFDRVEFKELASGWSNSIMVVEATVDIDYG